MGGLILLDLAPDGVYQATRVTPRPGGLLPHRFTLAHGVSSCWRFAFCCTFPSLTAGRRYRPSCSLEPGLSSETPAARATAFRRLPCLPDRAKYTRNRPTIHPLRASLREIQSIAIQPGESYNPKSSLAPANSITRPTLHQHSALRIPLASTWHILHQAGDRGASESKMESSCDRPVVASG